MSEHRDTPTPSHEEFVRLYTRHQRQIHAYVGAVLANPSDVEDVLQETSVVLWNKFHTFDRQKSFLAWARGIAHLEMMAYFRRQERAMLPLDPALLERLLGERTAMDDLLGQRRAALPKCMEQLRPQDQQLVQQCYSPGAKINLVAQQLERSPDAVYQSLMRIRRSLFECVNRTIAAEGRE